MSIPQQIQDLLAMRAVRAGTIVVGSIAAAYVIEWLIRRTLLALAHRTDTELDDKIVHALRRPIFISALFIGLSWAATVSGMAPQARYFVFGTLQTLAIVVWSVAGFRVGAAVLLALSRRGAGSIVQPRTLPIFDMIIKITAVAGGVYFTFLAWKIDLTAWLASAGIVGIAIGFAAKDSLANLFAGIFIIADAPYKVGDFIVLDGELRGRVTQIGMRSTRILTQDDVEITVPNAVIGNSKLVNEAGGPYVKQRVRVTVFAAYGADVDQVREVLLDSVDGMEALCETPVPQVRFRELGDSGLKFELLAWIDDPASRGRVIDELNTRVYKAFYAANLEIPFSKQDVYISPCQNQDQAMTDFPLRLRPASCTRFLIK